jgi:dTDP-4-amino-4,6-dideoxygalactose transaminase
MTPCRTSGSRKMGLYANLSLPLTERIARQGLYLPSGQAITEDQIDWVSAAMSSNIIRTAGVK